jgi:hypothetical protein
MKDTFKAFYQLSENEFEKLWDECLFVFDANVLLNLYRYTDETRAELTNILDKIKDRVWIPFQAGMEFHFNRLTVIQDQVDSYGKIKGILEDKKTDISKELNESFKNYIKRHPKVNISGIIEELKGKFDEVVSNIESARGDHPEFMKQDDILEYVTQIFNGKIGTQLTKEDLDELYKNGDKRYKNKIPPGYKDLEEKKGKKKFFNDQVFSDEFGDLVVWKEIIKKSQEENTPIIFITDDEKEDWWQIIKRRVTVGPRPELINEFNKETGQLFYMYKTFKFMEYAQSFLHNEVSQKAINEAKYVGESSKENTPSYKYKGESFDLNFLTDDDIKIYHNKVQWAEDESNSSVANALYQQAQEWAQQKVRWNKSTTLRYQKNIIDMLGQHLNGLTPVHRNEILSDVRSYRPILSQSEADKIIGNLIEKVYSIQADLGY